MDPYHHKHVAVEEVTWSRLGKLLVQLAEKINRDYTTMFPVRLRHWRPREWRKKA